MMPASHSGPELEYVNCPRCQSNGWGKIISGEDFLYEVPGEYWVAECNGCGLWFQNPRPSTGSLSSLYPDTYAPHVRVTAEAASATVSTAGLRQRIANAAGWRMQRINPLWRQASATSLTPTLVPGGSVLEVGCASGARLVELRRQGWRQVRGIEFAPTAARLARDLGFDVICGTAEEALSMIPEGSLDAVVSSMVLEHLHDPFAVVSKISTKLKLGGQFVFSTIVRDSLDAAIYGRYWAGFDFPRHMVHLTRDDIRRMLAQHFSQVRLIHQVAPVDFVRSSNWRIARGEGRWFDRIFLALGESLPARLFNLALAYLSKTTRVSVYCRRNGGQING
jgi:SAM-dependent methyltransferase